jgi:hypothetical protein
MWRRFWRSEYTVIWLLPGGVKTVNIRHASFTPRMSRHRQIRVTSSDRDVDEAGVAA